MFVFQSRISTMRLLMYRAVAVQAQVQLKAAAKLAGKDVKSKKHKKDKKHKKEKKDKGKHKSKRSRRDDGCAFTYSACSIMPYGQVHDEAC